MPWVCGSCGETVELDTSPSCPACEAEKTSWTVDAATRTFVVTAGNLEALRAPGREPVQGTEAWAAASWSGAGSAPLIEAAHLRRLLAQGRLPAPRDVLLARVPARPGAPLRDLVVTIEFEGRAASTVELPATRGASSGGQHVWRLILVRGSAAEATPPGAVVLDLSEDAAGGHAPWIELTWAGRTARLPVDRAPVVQHVEVEDARFLTDSAVPLPHEPAGAEVGASPWATCLRHVEEHPDERLLVAGHTDTVGDVAWNLELSARRAEAAHALLVGDRARWIAVVAKRHRVEDVQRLLGWVAVTLGWACDPGPPDGVWGPRSRQGLLGLQRAWNVELGPRSGTTIAEDGLLGPESWGALFDAQELALERELGEDPAGLAALRTRLVALDTARPSVGCGEHHPLEAVGRDGYRSQTNRRVELVLVGPDEPITLPCHDGGCAPERCVLYDPARTRHAPIDPMPSARRWTAAWDRERLRTGEPARLLVDAAGLPDGHALAFEVEQDDGHRLASLEGSATGGRVELTWVVVERVGPEPVDGSPTLRFVASGAGRRVASAPAPHEGVLGSWAEPLVTPVDGEAEPDTSGPPSSSEDGGRRGRWRAGEVRPTDGEAAPDASGPPSSSEDGGRRGRWRAGEVGPADGEAWPDPSGPASSSEDLGLRGSWWSADVRPIDGEAWPGPPEPARSEP